MRTTFIPSLLAVFFLLASCSKDDDTAVAEDFVVAFDSLSKEIAIVFSRTATDNGTISIAYTAEGALYDEDFTLEPQPQDGVIELSVSSGDTGASFTFNKLQNPLESEDIAVNFEIISVSVPSGYTQGNTTTVVNLTESAALGGSIAPEVGGPNQPNQVYVDLSTQQETARNRTSWDLGFYSGDQHRVIINGSVYMAAAQLDATNIDNVTEADVVNLQPQVAVGTFDPANVAYIDSPNGDINGTAIAAVSENDVDNHVYLVNMGYDIGTEIPNPGSVAIAGEPRGWMKIRVLRSGEDYVLQYANLNDTSHQTITISKNEAYNFSFFSMVNNNIVDVEPQNTQWDLNFTVFTNEIDGAGSYGYADFIASNRKGGVSGYMVEVNDIAYADFTIANIQDSNFDIDQRFIGSTWRIGGGPDTLPSLDETVYFIVKDPDGNLYKIRFTALLSDDGIRGYPSFEYELL